MPINYKLYPTNWKTEIRPSILKRANNCCEECGVKNKSVYITKGDQRIFLEQCNLMKGFYVCPDGIKRMKGRTGSWLLKQIVLTIAHIDHDINNNDSSNLKALCQMCHLNLDKEQHKTNARATRNKNKGLQELF